MWMICQKNGNAPNAEFILIFNQNSMNNDCTLEDIGIVENSNVILAFIVWIFVQFKMQDENNTPQKVLERVRCQEMIDPITKGIGSRFVSCIALSPVFELISSGKITEAYALIKPMLFGLENIPKAISMLRLRFACNISTSPFIITSSNSLSP